MSVSLLTFPPLIKSIWINVLWVKDTESTDRRRTIPTAAMWRLKREPSVQRPIIDSIVPGTARGVSLSPAIVDLCTCVAGYTQQESGTGRGGVLSGDRDNQEGRVSVMTMLTRMRAGIVAW